MGWTRRAGATAAAAGLLLLAACGDGAQAEEGPIRVTVTTNIAADLVESVGGEQVDVTSLMGPGIDPHLYRASQGDVRDLIEADLIVYHGLFLEGRMADILEGPAMERTLSLSDPLPLEQLLSPTGEMVDADSRVYADPHVWFEPELWLQVVDPVVDELVRFDPESRADFEAGAAQYVTDAEAAGEYSRDRLAQIPEHARVLVTSHDAFGYFGRAYDFEVLGVQGLSTEDEAGIRGIRELADLLVTDRIPALFTESSVSPAGIEAVQQAAADRGWPVTIPETDLYSDALGVPGSSADTYAGMLRANVDMIATALDTP